jgi:cytochrome P450
MMRTATHADMVPKNFLGNLIPYRRRQRHHPHTPVGSIYARARYPTSTGKLRENPALIDSFVPEVIRWQTPLAHMPRTRSRTSSSAATDQKGDKVVMWYVSGNRDEE